MLESAVDKASAARELKKRNLTVISIALEPEKKLSELGKTGAGAGKVNSMELVIFARQLATLIGAGVSLVMALAILADQIENGYFKKVVLGIKGDIEAGNSLHASFVKYLDVFPSVFVNMIKAGEKSGSLGGTLESVANDLEKIEAIRRKFISGLTYPIIVVGVAVLINIFLILKVVPVFKGIFSSMGGELPLPTAILVGLSDYSIKLFPFLAAGAVLLVFGIIKYIATERGRLQFDGLKLELPVFGPLVKKMVIAKFSRTLATLVKSGVSILEALEISGQVAGNKVIKGAVEQVKISLRSGENISGPMEETGKFPIFVVKMIAVGEQTAELEKMLTKISEYYESQVDEALSGLASMIEPIIIIFVGISVGYGVISMFLPIFKLTQMIGH